jgi:hypothetical protein
MVRYGDKAYTYNNPAKRTIRNYRSDMVVIDVKIPSVVNALLMESGIQVDDIINVALIKELHKHITTLKLIKKDRMDALNLGYSPRKWSQ